MVDFTRFDCSDVSMSVGLSHQESYSLSFSHLNSRSLITSTIQADIIQQLKNYMYLICDYQSSNSSELDLKVCVCIVYLYSMQYVLELQDSKGY